MFESRHKTLFLKKNKTETPARELGKIWKFAPFEIYGCKGYFMVEV